MSDEKVSQQSLGTGLDCVSEQTEDAVAIENIAEEMDFDSEENSVLIRQMQSELIKQDNDNEIIDIFDGDGLDDILLDEEEASFELNEKENENDEAARQEAKRERARQRAIDQAGKRNNTRSFIIRWNAIDAARKDDQFIQIRLSSVVVRSLNSAISKINREVCVVGLTNNEMPVLVPYSQLFLDDPISEDSIDLSTEFGQNSLVGRKKALCEKMYGLSIPVVITDMHEGIIDEDGKPVEFEIYASRTQAIKQIQKYNFGKSENRNRRMDVGRFVNATVISVSDKSIRVTVGGVDSTIPLAHLTFRYVASPDVLSEMYHVGDRIRCMIFEIKEKDDGTYDVSLDASIVEMLEARRKQDVLLQKGAQCVATITKTFPPREIGGQYDVQLIIDQYNMPAKATDININDFAVPLRPGDVMRCKVNKFSKNGMTYVRILNFHGPIPIR